MNLFSWIKSALLKIRRLYFKYKRIVLATLAAGFVFLYWQLFVLGWKFTPFQSRDYEMTLALDPAADTPDAAFIVNGDALDFHCFLGGGGLVDNPNRWGTNLTSRRNLVHVRVSVPSKGVNWSRTYNLRRGNRLFVNVHSGRLDVWSGQLRPEDGRE